MSSSNKGTGHSYEVLHLIIQAIPCRLPYTSHPIPSLSCPLLPFSFLPKIRQVAKERKKERKKGRKKERTTTTLRSLTHFTSNILSLPTHQHNEYSSAQEKDSSTKRGVVSLRNSIPPFLSLDIVSNNQGETPTPILPATASTSTPTSFSTALLPRRRLKPPEGTERALLFKGTVRYAGAGAGAGAGLRRMMRRAGGISHWRERHRDRGG